MSSGSYFPPPVKAVEIPKAGGKGVRVLGVPTVADRIAQTVAKLYLEPQVEAIFHPDSYGYRPGRSALDAVAVCRQRCWRAGWVIDMDIRSFFDTVPWDLVLKAVDRHTAPDQKWILLYVERWLKAPLQKPDGTLITRDRGTPQGSATRPFQDRLRRWVTVGDGCCNLIMDGVSGGECDEAPVGTGVLSQIPASGASSWVSLSFVLPGPHWQSRSCPSRYRMCAVTCWNCSPGFRTGGWARALIILLRPCWRWPRRRLWPG
jgi:hypothetical protein